MGNSVRILHLEDNLGDTLLVRSVLESEGLEYEIRNVSSREEFVAALSESKFDVVLSDYALPSFDGITALDLLRGRDSDLPFIFVSGTMGEELAIESLKAGATDYVLKDRLARLVPSLRRALAEAGEREERRRDTARMAMRFAVTNALAQSATFEEAAPKLLQAIGEGAGWDTGAVWLPDPGGTALSCAAFWRRPSREVIEFEEMTRTISFEKGLGLPGRIWASGEPAWILDLSTDPNFPRAATARAVGLRAGCGFPIRSGTRVIGVLDFFSRETRPPDETLSRILSDLGSQIGQFLERREAEEKLRRSEKMLAEAQRVAHVGSWEFELRSGRAFWSEESYRIVGEQLGAEFSFERFLSFVHPDDRDLIQKTVAKALQDRQPFRIDYRIVRADGAVRSVQARGEIVSGAEGTPKRMVGTVQDVTERVSLEAQLLQSQKIEAIGTLAGGIAHDFNNLLTSILGYSGLALSRLQPGNGLREDLEEIRKAGERAAALTRQLLAFSRKQVLTPVVLDLNAVVAELEKMLCRLIGEDIDLVSRLDRASGLVKADPGQIEQVIVNLVVNSRDAMPRGGKVTIETRKVDLGETYTREHAYVPPGPYVVLSVSDTGAGMDAETRSRIFEPFFTTKGAGKGTGLGLSTVYGIVKQSGGHVEVYTEPGRGTAFKIYLPRVEEGTPWAAPPPVTHPRRGCETILVVEDEEALRALARRILEASGYTVLEATSAENALEVSESHSGAIHLMLTDAVMPGQSGPELARQLGPARPDMKVLFMSGYTDDAIVRHGLLHSSQAFLQKPFSPEVLTGKVREVLESARG